MFEYRPVEKPSHNRRVKKRKARGEFSQKLIAEIRERDNEQCVCCGSYYLEPVPHHVVFKSQGGEGIKRNGVSICRSCHDWAHGKKSGPFGQPEREGRQWFVEWVERNLDENGNYKSMS